MVHFEESSDKVIAEAINPVKARSFRREEVWFSTAWCPIHKYAFLLNLGFLRSVDMFIFRFSLSLLGIPPAIAFMAKNEDLAASRAQIITGDMENRYKLRLCKFGVYKSQSIGELLCLLGSLWPNGYSIWLRTGRLGFNPQSGQNLWPLDLP